MFCLLVVVVVEVSKNMTRFHKTLRLLACLMLLWMASSWLARLHSGLVLLVALFTTSNLVLCWLVHARHRWAIELALAPLLGTYVRWICRWAQLPVPHHQQTDANKRQWLCQDPQDYTQVGLRLKRTVFGHDQTIDDLLLDIRAAAQIRKLQRSQAKSVLASFLLCGPDGIGKVFLAQQLASQLYRDGGCYRADCSRASYRQLFGDQQAEGELLKAVREQPFLLLCFEQIDAASDELRTAIEELLSSSRFSGGGQTAPISFAHTVICLTLTLPKVDELTNLSASWGQQEVQDKMNTVLQRESPLSNSLLQQLSSIYVMTRPDVMAQAQVVALSMQREASEYGKTLTYVDPILIVSELLRLQSEAGFAHLSRHIHKLLQQPLLAASREQAALLGLHVQPIPSPARD